MKPLQPITCYIPVSVDDELPLTDDKVFVETNFFVQESCYYEDGEWHGDLRGDTDNPEVVTKWLKEKSLYVFSKDELTALVDKVMTDATRTSKYKHEYIKELLP